MRRRPPRSERGAVGTIEPDGHGRTGSVRHLRCGGRGGGKEQMRGSVCYLVRMDRQRFRRGPDMSTPVTVQRRLDPVVRG